VALAIPPQTGVSEADRASFLDACQRQCTPLLGDPDACRAVCVCSADNLVAAGLWERTITQTLGSDDQAVVDSIVEACGVEASQSLPVE